MYPHNESINQLADRGVAVRLVQQASVAVMAISPNTETGVATWCREAAPQPVAPPTKETHVPAATVGVPSIPQPCASAGGSVVGKA